MSNILVVDDEPAICWGVKELLESEGHRVQVLSSGEAALESIRKEEPDLLLMDVRMPGISGIEALDALRKNHPNLPVVIMTAFGELEIAVQVMRHPSVDYLAKPFDLDQVAGVVARMLADACTKVSESGTAEPSDSRVLLGRTPQMQVLFKQIAMAAAGDLPVLITGESGTGKELVAHWIHQHSRRARRPYIPMAPIALSPTLFESEMFGHVKGAFTGATENKQGVFSRADGGTVFLDEIGDLPVEQQIKLLRVIELRQFTAVGDSTAKSCDVRIISATNRDLFRAIREEKFREDLFFRLAGIHIQLPPLRERLDDIPILVEHFLKALGAPEPTELLTDDFIAELKTRRWRGNVRELRHATEHAYLMARGKRLRAEYLPAQPEDHYALSSDRNSGSLQSPEKTSSGLAGETIAPSKAEAIAALIESWLAEQAAEASGDGDLYERLLNIIEPPVLKFLLDKHHGNKSALAEQLGWHRATVRKRLRQYGLDNLEN